MKSLTNLLCYALTNIREDCLTEEHEMKTVPLFTIGPGFVVPDAVHMRIREVNRPIDSLLSEAEDRDNRGKVVNIGGKDVHLEANKQLRCQI